MKGLDQLFKETGKRQATAMKCHKTARNYQRIVQSGYHSRGSAKAEWGQNVVLLTENKGVRVAVENVEQRFALGCEKNVATNCKRVSYPILESLLAASPVIVRRSPRDRSAGAVPETLYTSLLSSMAA